MAVLPVSEFGLHCIRQGMADAVIVFAHGILSNGNDAWGQPSWPDLLAAEPEFANIGIFVFTYQTTLSSSTYGIADVAEALREHLRLENLLSMKNIVFVCHSLGGIAVRRLLVVHQRDLIRDKQRIGLFLVASPSLGSRDANLLSLLSFALKHTQAAVLRFSQANTSLDELHRDFRALLNDRAVSIEGRELIEDRAITIKRWFGLRRQVVEPFSAAQYFATPGHEPFKVPGSDHSSIVKPLHSGAIQHLILKSFVSEFIVSHTNNPLTPIDEEETSRAYSAVTALKRNLEIVVTKPDALGKLQYVLFETRQYVEGRRKGQARNSQTELRLAGLWNDTGNALHKYDPTLASLCWIKGHGWADERLWTDPRFINLPLELNDMLERLYLAMGRQAEDMPGLIEESRKALGALTGALERFEEVRPALTKHLGRPAVVKGEHAVMQRLSDGGNSLEFVGLGQTGKVTIEHLLNLPSDQRQTIRASEEGMNKLKAEFETLIAKGLLSKEEDEKLLVISSQMGERMTLILGIVETALGGPLEDHYAAQRRIAEYAVSRREHAPPRAAADSGN